MGLSSLTWRRSRIGGESPPTSADLFRQGKASISAELAGIFERLNLSAQNWQNRIEKLGGDRLLGRFFASTRARLRDIAERLGVRHLVNLRGCPVR